MKRYFQRGGAAPLMLLLITGGLVAAAYATDASRMKSNAAQLKRATDAAALAVSQAHARDPSIDVRAMAQRYVESNLGLDATELEQTLTISTEPVETSEGKGYRVHAQFRASAILPGSSAQNVRVHSAAIARYSPLEIALVLPNTNSESSGDIAALRRLGKEFATQLLEGTDENSTTWISLVPYSQSVNVYDAEDPTRIRRWAMAGALTPPELRSLFRSGKASNVADRRMPDRIANLLCMYRGLNARQNFFWDQAPTGQFKIYYRHDLPENGSPGAPPISWEGPNPDFGLPNGITDTRWIVADKGCPNAPLLPLTSNLTEIEERLDSMSVRFNVNYAIAMSWAGATLSPAMRGGAGWGDADKPLAFNEDDSKPNRKVIIMLANTIGDWFDTDSYNAEVGQGIGTAQSGNSGGLAFATQRFIDLCNSFQSRNLQFHFLGVRPGNPEDFGRALFDQVAGPGLQICAARNGSMQFFEGTGMQNAEDNLASELKKLAEALRREASFSRLIE